MSLFWRSAPAASAPERRAHLLPYLPAYPTGWATYQDVDPTVGEVSMQAVAVGAAVDLIMSLVSELPVDVFSGSGADKRERAVPGYLQDPGGDGYGLEDWIAQALKSWLLRGNLYGEVLSWGGSGSYPTQVSWYHPDCVGAMLDGKGGVDWLVSGQRVTDLESFWHLRVNPTPGIILGRSPINAHAASIGLNITGTQFGLQYFKDGAHPSGILSNSEADLSEEKTVRTVKDRFLAAVRGSREPVVLGRGWEWQSISIAPDESQFLETNKYTAAECARIFGPGMPEILGYETGGSLTYVTVEGKSVHLSVYTLNKWIRRVERLLTRMLPRPQYARLNRKALLETTTLDRFNAHQIALVNQWTTPNEVRDVEDMPPATWDGADQPITPGQSQIKEKVPTVD